MRKIEAFQYIMEWKHQPLVLKELMRRRLLVTVQFKDAVDMDQAQTVSLGTHVMVILTKLDLLGKI